MDIEVLKSYLVNLGFQVNQPELRKFEVGLKDAAGLVESATTGVVKSLIKWQVAGITAFTGISGAVIGMADQVATADQRYRLLGLRMMMSTEQARKMQVSLDALGVSLEEAIWDPELRARFIEMGELQDKLATKLGTNFKANMVAIRDVKQRFQELRIEFEYVSMAFVSKLAEVLGPQLTLLQAKFESFTAYVIEHIPEWSDEFSTVLIPILRQTWEILKEVGSALGTAANLFTNLVGLFSGDSAIEGTEFSFRKLGGAIQHVTEWISTFLICLTHAEQSLVHFANSATLVMAGRFDDAKAELLAAHQEAMFDPTGQAPSGGSVAVGGAAGATGDLAAQVTARAKAIGLDPRIALAIASQESGIRQFDSNGQVVANPGSSARGIFQLLAGTARSLGVDRNDTAQNIDGGTRYLSMLLHRYGGDQTKAITAYYWGEGNLDRAITRHSAIPMDALNYTRGVLRREGQNVSTSQIQINIMQPGATAAEIGNVVDQRMREHSARNLAQLGFL